MTKFILLIIVLVGCFQAFGQNGSLENKGKIIVQVFGVADYNAIKDVKKKYGFRIARAHFGYQYQFNDKISAKIILDRGRPTTVAQINITDTSLNKLNVSNSPKEGSYYTMTLKFAILA